MPKSKLINEIELHIEFRSVVDSYKSVLVAKVNNEILAPTHDLDRLIREYWGQSIPILGIKKLNIICYNYKSNKISIVVSCYLTSSEFRKAKIDSLCLEMSV